MFEHLLPILAFAEETIAGNGDIIAVIQGLAGQLLVKARLVVMPIAMIALIFQGIKIAMASSPQTVDRAKQTMMYIVIGIVIVMFAPAVLELLKQLSNQAGFTW